METKAVSGAMRWLYAAVGLVVLLFAGFVYGWSVFAAPIGADFPQWSAAELSLTFTICMAFFCLGGFAAGNLSKRIPVRANVLFSAALFLVGFFLVSRASSLPMLYVSYGVLHSLRLCLQLGDEHHDQVVSQQPGTDLRRAADGVRLQQHGAGRPL